MATQDKASWDGQEKSVGEIGEAQCPQGGREAVQKRTFTRWMNVSLQRCEPPVEVHDLFTDIQDGRVLMALLEELSGCKLVYRFRPSSHRIFRLNNIAKALAFLDDRHVKLLGIDASGIADGIPSVVLNLVWKIILYFQIKELTGGLERPFSSSLSSLSMSSYPSASDLSPLSSNNRSFSSSTLPTKGRRASRTPKYHGKVIKTLLHWVQRCASKFGVEVRDFGKSWRSGLAFLAMIKSIDPALVDLRDGLSREPRENVQEAFLIAQHSLGIPPLLEPEDVTCTSPDERSIITYVSMFLEHYSDVDEDHTTDIEMRINIPEIPSFTSPESMSFGETLAHQPEAQALIKGLEKTNEQLLWKRWARRCSGEPHATSLYMKGGGITSDLSNTNNIFSSYNPPNGIEQTVGNTTASQFNKDKPISVVKPISPLDIDNIDPETRSWIEKATVDQVYSKPSMDEGHFSQSSEEGIYNLSALDSDEEDAYSYILDLNKEVFQSYNQLNGQEPRVEEGTIEGKISNRQMTRESKRLNASEVLTENGAECYSRHQESLLALNGDFDRVQSKDQGNIDVEENRNSFRDEQQKIREANGFRETVNGREMCDVEEKSEDEGRSEDEFEEGREGVAREENNDGDDEEEDKEKKEKRENVTFVTDGYDERETRVDEADNAEFLEDAGLEKEVEAEIEGQVKKNMEVEKEGEERKAGKQEEGEEEEELENGVKKEEEHSVVDFQSFKVENQKLFIDESACKVRETAEVRVSKEGEEDRSDNVAPMEEVTKVEEEEGLQKDHKDEGEEEDNNELTNAKDFEDVVTVEEKAEEQKNKKHNPLTETATRIGHPTEITLEESMKADVNLHDDGKNNRASACSSTSKSSSSEGGVILQSLAASGELTLLELELLSVLWILLYCYFILPQMNL